MDPKIARLTHRIQARAAGSGGRSPGASAMFPTGLGAPDGRLARSEARFADAPAPGVAGVGGPSWFPAPVAPAAFMPTGPVQRARLRVLVVEYGARVPSTGLDGYDALALRLRGPAHLPDAVRAVAAAAGHGRDQMVIVDRDLPIWGRPDATPTDLRGYGVTVFAEGDPRFAEFYDLHDAPAE